MSELLNLAKEKSQHQVGKRNVMLTDELAAELILAYVNKDVLIPSLSKTLKNIEYKITKTEALTILTSRLLGLIRRGKLKLVKP